VLRPLLKKVGLVGIHNLGGLDLIRHRHRDQLRIVYYHRFEEPERSLAAEFEAQCSHFQRYYSPISLSEAARCLAGGQPLPPNALVVTIDDGFRDFYRIAYPIARKYGVPCTVYLVSDFLEHKTWLWWSVIQYTLLHTPRTSWSAPDANRPLAVKFQSVAERMDAAGHVSNWLKKWNTAERLSYVKAFPAEMSVELPAHPTPYFEPLTWDEVREMRRNGMEFGPHTQTHPLLPQLATQKELEHEIGGSRLVLEDRLQEQAGHFCYPNGDYDERCRQIVRRLGMTTTVTCKPVLNGVGSDPLELGRIGLEPGVDRLWFERVLAGFRL
jgi:peptidoglycan/xylan/chitin deacetylase (PgdA/CDA1 family)